MFKIIYQDTYHQNRFYTYLTDANTSPSDNERISLFYLLSLDYVAPHVHEIYDFEENSLADTPQHILEQSWITGGSRRTLTLAFNLFNQFQNDSCTPSDVFSYGNLDYLIQAIRLRYNREIE